MVEGASAALFPKATEWELQTRSQPGKPGERIVQMLEIQEPREGTLKTMSNTPQWNGNTVWVRTGTETAGGRLSLEPRVTLQVYCGFRKDGPA